MGSSFAHVLFSKRSFLAYCEHSNSRSFGGSSIRKDQPTLREADYLLEEIRFRNKKFK